MKSRLCAEIFPALTLGVACRPHISLFIENDGARGRIRVLIGGLFGFGLNMRISVGPRCNRVAPNSPCRTSIAMDRISVGLVVGGGYIRDWIGQ